MPGMAHVRIQKSTKIHCICNKVMFEKRIICANNDCKYEFFHLKCVKMKRRPKKKRKWFCEECIDTPDPPSSAPQSSNVPPSSQSLNNQNMDNTMSFPAVTGSNNGTTLNDQANQQNTLSHISTASAEDPQCVTPKSRKNDPYNHGDLPLSIASPEEYEMHSPTNWPRTPGSRQSLPNHEAVPHSQFPPYQPNWALSDVQGVMHNHGQPNTSAPLPPQQTSIGLPTPTASQSYDNGGSGMHPHHMGPPHGLMNPPTIINQSSAPQSSNVPPSSQSLNNQNMDNTMSFPAVTSVATTGFNNGTPLNDQANQQNTLSHISTAYAEDPQCVTPKSRKNYPYNHGDLPLPIASPEEYEIHSPTHWPRIPASPGFWLILIFILLYFFIIILFERHAKFIKAFSQLFFL